MDTKVCYAVEFQHGDNRCRTVMKSTVETERAYELVAQKICNEIVGVTVQFTMSDGEVITKELEADDIKDMWIETIV